MAAYHVVHRAASGPPCLLVVQADGARRAAEEAARQLSVAYGRFFVYRWFDRRGIIYDGEVEVAAGRALSKRGVRS